MIRGTHERSRLDSRETHGLSLGAEALELLGCVIALDGKPALVWLQVLADRGDVAGCATDLCA
jgi:hypothetical protein